MLTFLLFTDDFKLKIKRKIYHAMKLPCDELVCRQNVDRQNVDKQNVEQTKCRTDKTSNRQNV